MSASRVYFTDMRATEEENLPAKLARLAKTAGIGNIDFKNRFAAIKIHFGELGNLAFLRPNYARAIVDVIKSLGGKPFLTDANTLYVGQRKNALDHLDTAYTNGFSPFSTGCHILIADGLKGTDEVSVPVPNGVLVKEAKIGRALMDADIVISLSHFKCHEMTGIGGAIKNIGMGGGSRAGKMEMHSDGKPVVDGGACIGCGKCAQNCAVAAPVLSAGKCAIDTALCLGCGRCIGVCPVDAIDPAWDTAPESLDKKMSEYAAAALAGRPHFHISLAIDISPCCDCHSENDIPIVPDIGMFASFDPVALDAACADAVNRQPPNPGSALAGKTGADHFVSVHPVTANWRIGLEHAERLGLGSVKYELVTI